MLLLLSLFSLAYAKKFYTPLYPDAGPYYSKLVKNETVSFVAGKLHWEYYQVQIDVTTSHLIVNTTWDTEQYVRDGHEESGVMLTYAAKETFPYPTHWDWRGATTFESGSTSVLMNCANLAPYTRLLIAVAGHKGANYRIEVTSVTGVFSKPIELEWEKEYEVCSNEEACDIVPNQYVTYHVQTPESCQRHDDCCYAVTVKGDFGLFDGFRMYVNHDDIIPTRAVHDYMYMPMMTHGEILNPDRRDRMKPNPYDIKLSKDERIHVDGDGVYLPTSESEGVHYISATLTAGAAFFVGDSDHKITLQFIEEEGEICDWKYAEHVFEIWDEMDMDDITNDQLEELERFRKDQERKADENDKEVEMMAIERKSLQLSKKTAFPFF